VDGIKVFSPKNGYGLEGCYQENLAFSKKEKETIIFCFDTREGHVFDISRHVKEELDIPLVSFVYFTVEERWWRSQFTEWGKNRLGLADQKEEEQYFISRQKILQDMIHFSDAVIVPTHYVRGQLLALSSVEDAYKMHVCYHGIPPVTGSRKTWKKEAPFLQACRMHVPYACDKGFLWGLETFLKHSFAQKLYVCGQGNALDALKDIVQKEQASDRIIFKGLLPQSQLFSLMEECSCALVPSMMEAGCTFAVESAAHGCLPIALDAAGLGEIMYMLGLSDYTLRMVPYFLDEKTHIFVPKEEEFLALLQGLDGKKVNQDLKKANAVIEEYFTVSKTTERLLDLLKWI